MKINFLEKLKMFIKLPKTGRRSSLQALGEKLDACSVRDRGVFLAIVIVLIFAIWYFGLMYPASKSKVKLKLQIAVKEKQVKEIQLKYQTVLSSLQGKDSQGKQKELQAQLKQLDQNINQMVGDVVPVDQMADLLKDVLVKKHNLTLVSLKSTSARDVGTPGEKTDASYRLVNQGVQMVFEGDYQNTYNYLRYLEQSKWRIFWDRLSYDVTQYPDAKVTIDAHTLIQYKKPLEASTTPTAIQKATEKAGMVDYSKKRAAQGATKKK